MYEVIQNYNIKYNENINIDIVLERFSYVWWGMGEVTGFDLDN